MRKTITKYFACFIAAFLCISLLPISLFASEAWDGSTIATSYESGEGSEASPYIIKHGAQLAYLSAQVDAKELYKDVYFKLAADIDLGGKGWKPIGKTNAVSFQGIFDGDGYTVKNFKIDSTNATTRSGLFGVTTNATIKNLKIDNATITMTPASSTIYTAAVVGLARGGLISNCSVGANVVIENVDGSTGGIAGRLMSGGSDDKPGTIEYCTNAATVKASNPSGIFIGGIAGVIGEHSTVRYCINTGSVVGTRTSGTALDVYAGGIAGITGASSKPGHISNCYNTADVKGVTTGGIVGRTHAANSTIINSYNIGTAEGDEGIAGSFIGSVQTSSTFTDCYSTEQAGMPIFGGNPSNSDVSGIKSGTAAELKLLTDAIDLEVYGEAESEGESTTAAPTTTAPTPTTTKPEDAPQTFDGIILILAVLAAGVLLIVFVSKNSKKSKI